METIEDWVCVLAASFCMFGFAGYSFIHGIFYLQFLDVFNRGPLLTSWTEAGASLTMMICGPIAGFLLNRFSPKILLVVGGLMFSTFFVGLAFAPTMEVVLTWFALLGGPSRGLGIVTAVVYINRRFSEKRQRANGVFMLFMSFCGILYPFLLQTLLEIYSLRGCLLIHAGVMLHICFFAQLLRERSVSTGHDLGTQVADVNEQERKLLETNKATENESISNNDKIGEVSMEIITKSDGKQKNSGRNLFATFKTLGNLKYVTFLVWVFGGHCALFASLQFLPAYGREIGMSDVDCTRLPAITSAFETAGRLFLIVFGDAKWMRKDILITVSWTILGIVAIVLPLVANHWLLYFVAALFGLLYDTMHIFVGSLIVESAGQENLGLATGMLPVMFGIARLSVPPICGFLRERTGTYGNAMNTGGVAFITATVVFAIVGQRLPCPCRKDK